ncbi:MAG TPA: hypothetical protein VMD91_03180 [Candidatus Sulfotelmatobacter sp.]|nr:hypothetical protein [Candidatus Sulfotelmatobacter sp.]
MTQQKIRHRSADVAVGYAVTPAGRGIAYATIATGTGRTLAKVPFGAVPLGALDGREFGYAALTAVAGYLRTNGFTRVRIRLGDGRTVDDLAARTSVPPALTMAYVKARCALHGFALARVERAEPVETNELEARARADIAQRPAAAA